MLKDGGVEATRDFILLVSLWTRRRWKFQANSHTLTVWVTRAASSVLIGRLCWEQIELLQQKCFCSVWSAGPQSPSVLGPNNEALSLVADVTFTYCDSKTGTTKKKKSRMADWSVQIRVDSSRSRVAGSNFAPHTHVWKSWCLSARIKKVIASCALLHQIVLILSLLLYFMMVVCSNWRLSAFWLTVGVKLKSLLESEKRWRWSRRRRSFQAVKSGQRSYTVLHLASWGRCVISRWCRLPFLWGC